MDENTYLKALDDLWEKNWPANLPRETEYPLGKAPLTEYLRHWAKERPDKACLIYYGREISFKEIDELSDRFASFLHEKGLVKGDRVAVLLPNCPQFLIAFFGVLKLGCVHVPVNPLFKEQEFIYEMQDAEPRAIAALDLLYPLVQGTRDQTSLEFCLTTSLRDFLPDNPTIQIPDLAQIPPQECPGAMNFMDVLNEDRPGPPKVDVSLDDLAALNYTGGTTGMPKGCEHTHGNMLYTAATGATFALENPTDEDKLLNYLPIFWIAGEDAGVLSPAFTGSTEVMLVRWDPKAVFQAIERYKITIAYGLVDNVVELMEHPEAGNYDLGSLRTMLVSSFVKKLNVDYRRRWETFAGCVLREGAYGMTETHTMDTFTTGLQKDDMDVTGQPVFVGLPMPGTRFKIVDFITKELVPFGTEGEIVIKTPSLMRSYWKKPEAAADLMKDGWFYTGDIGMISEQGFIHFLGRTKEMLKVKGMSVFPSEIESLLGRHPDIAGSGVIGRPDEEKGEVPVAFIMVRSDRKDEVAEKDIKEWCGKNMATYKIPEIRIVDELPMTATGKVKKEELKQFL